MLIDRGFYGSHIKRLLGGIKGVGVSSGRMRSFFLISFFFYFAAAAAAAGARMCKKFHFAVARGGDLFFFVDKLLVET